MTTAWWLRVRPSSAVCAFRSMGPATGRRRARNPTSFLTSWNPRRRRMGSRRMPMLSWVVCGVPHC
eukprot:8228520-Alexandrium_andersonii.AAC.1